MSTPMRVAESSSSGTGTSSSSRGNRSGSANQTLGGGNPFRGGSSTSHSGAPSSSWRENTPSFADCFAGFEATHHFNLGESPGAMSPAPMQRSELANPASTGINLPPGSGAAAADFSFNSLQLSTDVSQAGTPPPRIERQSSSSPSPIHGATPIGASNSKAMTTPQRPPLAPNISPIVATHDIETAVASGYVSPGHHQGAQFMQSTMYSTPSHQEAAVAPHEEVTLQQEAFQRSMREAEEEQAFSQQSEGGGPTSSHTGSGGATAPGTAPMYASAGSRGTQSAPSSTGIPGTTGSSPAPRGGHDKMSPHHAGAASDEIDQLVAVLTSFKGASTPAQRAAMIQFLAAQEQPHPTSGGPSSTDRQGNDADGADVWSLPRQPSAADRAAYPYGGRRRHGGTDMEAVDPLTTIAPDFSYFQPQFTGSIASNGVTMGLPSRWRATYSDALWKASLTSSGAMPPYGTSHSLATQTYY